MEHEKNPRGALVGFLRFCLAHIQMLYPYHSYLTDASTFSLSKVSILIPLLWRIGRPSLGVDREALERDWERGSSLTELAELRSEERRVGKECRSRWSPYH